MLSPGSSIQQELLSAYVAMERLEVALGGATALNIYLLHKVGGQISIDKAEMGRITSEFSKLSYAVNNGNLTVKLCSTPEEDREPVEMGGYGY